MATEHHRSLDSHKHTLDMASLADIIRDHHLVDAQLGSRGLCSRAHISPDVHASIVIPTRVAMDPVAVISEPCSHNATKPSQ